MGTFISASSRSRAGFRFDCRDCPVADLPSLRLLHPLSCRRLSFLLLDLLVGSEVDVPGHCMVANVHPLFAGSGALRQNEFRRVGLTDLPLRIEDLGKLPARE